MSENGRAESARDATQRRHQSSRSVPRGSKCGGAETSTRSRVPYGSRYGIFMSDHTLHLYRTLLSKTHASQMPCHIYHLDHVEQCSTYKLRAARINSAPILRIPFRRVSARINSAPILRIPFRRVSASMVHLSA